MAFTDGSVDPPEVDSIDVQLGEGEAGVGKITWENGLFMGFYGGLMGSNGI